MPPDDALPVQRPTWLLALVLAVATVGADLAWLAWDQEYQRDPVTGASSGPYEAWQVLGCALTLGALALVAGLRGRPGLALGVIPAVFTVTWSMRAAPTDTSGLWVIGSTLLLLGSCAGTAVVAYSAAAWARARVRR